MELLEFPSFPVLLASLLFLFMVVKFLKKSKSKLPPGPTELPLIGNLHQLAGSTLPHRSLRDLAQKHGPLMHLKLGEISAIVISSAEAAEAALKTHELSFSQRPILVAVDVMAYGGSGVVFSPYGKYWRQLRKIITTELLSVKRVRSFRSVREEEVWNFIDSISSSAGHSINLTEKIYKLTSCITSRAMFGKECKDASEFVKVVTEGSELGAQMIFSERVLHYRLILDVIIQDIFGAGTDTTATTTEWAMAELLKHPTIMEKAQAEVRKVLEGKSKICEEDIQELNYLKFGTNFQYIPFGSGRRMCPGISFGISTVEYQLALMLYHFNWELPNGMKPQELNMTEVFGATVKKKDPLFLTAAQMS
ncbi:hypothetical protein RJ640_029452 [Escallonia rubra]|uniref:Cytochrome P450 n=1 Tax=Escallonia rubra TaxID=112253 RepID=A0AA88UKU1_9ASTE|nr:hypothetical protein RJ640_009672 [Escallonia rubra]KAK2986337.1 hypothetical protein RJ640_029452 [Escallonia rubra]